MPLKRIIKFKSNLYISASKIKFENFQSFSETRDYVMQRHNISVALGSRNHKLTLIFMHCKLSLITKLFK